MDSLEQEWIKGDITLGTAANWTSDEIRLVSELGYALAQQGRNSEAIVIFEGLSALAPATHYFDSALGALWLREAVFEKAVQHLDSALRSDPDDIPNRVNRAEALIHEQQIEKAIEDLDHVFSSTRDISKDSSLDNILIRARALRATINPKDSSAI